MMKKPVDIEKKVEASESVRSAAENEKRHQLERSESSDCNRWQDFVDTCTFCVYIMTPEEKIKRSTHSLPATKCCQITRAQAIPSGKVMHHGTVRVTTDQPMDQVTSKRSLEMKNNEPIIQSFDSSDWNDWFQGAVVRRLLQRTPPSPTTVRRKHMVVVVAVQEQGNTEVTVPCSSTVESGISEGMPSDTVHVGKDQMDAETGEQSMEPERDKNHASASIGEADTILHQSSPPSPTWLSELTPPKPVMVRRKYKVSSAQQSAKRKAKPAAHQRCCYKKRRFRVPATLPVDQPKQKGSEVYLT